MTEQAASPDLRSTDDFFAIVCLVVATLLILAMGEWPYGYNQFLRIAVFALSLAIANRSSGTEGRGWLIFAVVGAVLFNPIFPIKWTKDGWEIPDLVFAVGYAAYGVGAMSQKLAHAAAIVLTFAFVLLLCVSFYVGHYLPHGPAIPTGDYVCLNDGRGPCGAELFEDMSKLDIPEWAKFVKRFNVLGLIMLPLTAAYCHAMSTRKSSD